MSRSTLPYMPRLDGLRGLAISGVLAEHFLPDRFASGFSPGSFGVLLFFVLSGYLITRILLHYKDQGMPVTTAAAHFYWRRLLRLAPPYYFAIGAAAFFGLLNMRSDWWAHALYLSNIKFAFRGWNGGAAHFWSLSIEEQFYLIWFFVIVMLPRRFLPVAMLASIGIPPLYRLTLYLLVKPQIFHWTILLPGKMDSLAIGALIAYVGCSQRLRFIDRLFLDKRLLIFSTVALLLLSYRQPVDGARYTLVWPLTVNLFAACLVKAAAEQTKDYLVDWLTWHPLRYLGRISYGIYVYHFFLPSLIFLIWPAFKTLAHGQFVILTLASIVTATVSYRLMERPILRFKDRVVGEVQLTPVHQTQANSEKAILLANQ